MKLCFSITDQLKELLQLIVSSPTLHAKWLNTLSFLENCGARKIAACEHPTLVKEEMLKHASEEFRHAHHLKRQIAKIYSDPIETYALKYLLGKTATLHYLQALDLRTCRYLKSEGLSKIAIKQAAYLLVTYAIERRAETLYPVYDQILRSINSHVTVKSILLEEQEHLHEMEKGLEELSHGWKYAQYVCALEASLYQNWLYHLGDDMSNKTP